MMYYMEQAGLSAREAAMHIDEIKRIVRVHLSVRTKKSA